MGHFSNGFQDELKKIAQVHWASRAFPVLQKTLAPALATGTIGAIVGSRVAEDPGTGAAKGALIGVLAGITPSAIHEYFKRSYPNVGMLEGIPATLTGAGAGAALGALASDENKGTGAALGTLAGGAAAGIPAYLGLAKRGF